MRSACEVETIRLSSRQKSRVLRIFCCRMMRQNPRSNPITLCSLLKSYTLIHHAEINCCAFACAFKVGAVLDKCQS